MSSTVLIRPARADDLPAIRRLAAAAGLFTEDEAAEVITAVDAADGAALWLCAVDADALVGAVYAGPEPVSDAVWNMYFLAVDPERHASGVGTALVAAVEAALASLPEGAASALLVETSSGPAYAGARGFYAARGYTQVGQVPRYYAPDEDKVVFWKPLR